MMKWFGEYQKAFIYKSREILNRDILLQITSAHQVLCLRFPYQKPKWKFSSMAQQLLYASSEDTYVFLSVGNATCYAHWIHLWAGVTNKTRHTVGQIFSLFLCPFPPPPSPSSSSLCWGITAWTLCMLGKWAIIEPQFLPTCGVDWFASKCYMRLRVLKNTLFGTTVQAKRSLKQFACISCWLTLYSLCCCCYKTVGQKECSSGWRQLCGQLKQQVNIGMQAKQMLESNSLILLFYPLPLVCVGGEGEDGGREGKRVSHVARLVS